MQIDNKFLEESAKIAKQLQNILKKCFKDHSGEEAFQIGTYALASLLGGFIDAIIANSFYEKKLILADDILWLTKMLLHSKQIERTNNSGEKH